jgi:hypothetical protein
MSQMSETRTVILTTRGGKRIGATYRTDLETGRAEFEVSGPAVSGVIVLEPEATWTERFYPKAYEDTVRVIFGRGPVGAKDAELTDAPVINRVELRRGSFHLAMSAERARYKVGDYGIRAFIRRENSSECPAATKSAAADVVFALAEYWRQLPEWPELVAAFLRRAAPALIAAQQAPMNEAIRTMAAQARRIQECAEVIEVWRRYVEPEQAAAETDVPQEPDEHDQDGGSRQ